MLERTWGPSPLVADLTAGGGSIPFASARLGLRTYANDLNGVAAAVLRCGVQYPAEFGPDLIDDLEKWGRALTARVQARIAPFFKSGEHEQVATFIWAHAVPCPRTRKIVPLVPNWTVRSEPGKEVAVRLVTRRDGVELGAPEFEICQGAEIDFDPKFGTVKRGDALSPWDDQVIDASYIREQAQAGLLSQILYTVVVRDGQRLSRSSLNFGGGPC